MQDEGVKKGKTIQSVQRAIDILNCFDAENNILTLNEMSERTGLNINTVRGIVNTLMENDILLHDREDNVYYLGPFFLRKIYRENGISELVFRISRPEIQKLTNQYEITMSLQEVGETGISTIYCCYPESSNYKILLNENKSLPLYASSSGKLLLYYNYWKVNKSFPKINFYKYAKNTIMTNEELAQAMNDIEQYKFSSEIEEYCNNIAGLAVPITDTVNRLIYSVSFTTFRDHYEEIRNNVATDLLKISQIINEKIK